LLSEVLATAAESVDAGAVLEGLAGRERLGSTALGDAVAMPHARIEGVERSIGAFLRLGKGVAFDAPDGEPVSLLFGLLMPMDCSDSQLGELKELIAHLRDPVLQERLREVENPAELYTLLTDSLTAVYRKLGV
ncbi:MAG TPA: PTS sugar transporter subunit IIA, partial [Gammaproteobacteria bacterium]|nr:PTS sugar transporter subunit IIA [Gammaproteobacteria bacterium]